MSIIDYDSKYDEDIKDLLVELQEYIVSIDEDKYNIITPEYREKYFEETMEEVNKYKGKILLAEENNEIVGLVIGLINNEETNEYDFKAPKRGRITELIIKKEYRSLGIGDTLLKAMENYFKSIDCKAVIIEVFGFNNSAINFYSKKGYHNRTMEVMKKID